MAAKNLGQRSGSGASKPDARGVKGPKKIDLKSVTGGFIPNEIPVETKTPPMTIKIKLSDGDLKG